MSDRPEISGDMDVNTFRSFYYLKEELVDFCKTAGLQSTGSKIEITNRIAYYLDTGKKLPITAERKEKNKVDTITLESEIEPNIVCSEKHRAFFVENIGKQFSFNVAFQKWLKANSGKTYKQAIDAYYQILEERKKTKTTIDKQFEYNRYIRDFFEDNEGSTLEDAIKCWKYKKGISGRNLYEKKDLQALEE
jgi:dTDP-glucose pyrophosphorylase